MAYGDGVNNGFGLTQDNYGNWIPVGGQANATPLPDLQASNTGTGNQRLNGNLVGPAGGATVSTPETSYNNTPAYDPNAAARAAQQQAANSQIDTINRLLGSYRTRLDSGVADLNAGSVEQKRRLTEQRTSANAGYDKQGVQNQQQQSRGYEQVDNFANNSSNSLGRVFQGANSGNSSVARLLAPHLVGKAAGSRRLGVTQTANENKDNILSARTDANSQFDYSGQDLENQRKAQERQLREGFGNQELDLLGKKEAFQRDAGLASDGTRGEIDQRMNALDSLFGSFKPQYNVRAAAPKAVGLNSYSVDPAQYRLDANAPAETRYYAPQLKKKQQGIA